MSTRNRGDELAYSLAKWSYIISERLTPSRPKWLHLLVCSHCRGIGRWLREQQREAGPVNSSSDEEGAAS